jgi:hypothetical protein
MRSPVNGQPVRHRIADAMPGDEILVRHCTIFVGVFHLLIIVSRNIRTWQLRHCNRSLRCQGQHPRKSISTTILVHLYTLCAVTAICFLFVFLSLPSQSCVGCAGLPHAATFSINWPLLCNAVLSRSTVVIKDSHVGILQAVNEDGKLAWTRVTVLRSFRPQLPDTRFLSMTTAAGQVRRVTWLDQEWILLLLGGYPRSVQPPSSQTCRQALQQAEQSSHMPACSEVHGEHLRCMPLCSCTHDHGRLMWLQVLTVTSCHMIYKAEEGDGHGLHPPMTPSVNATLAADFAKRIPIAARNVKVHLLMFIPLN